MQFGQILQYLMDENNIAPRQLAKALCISHLMVKNFTLCVDEPTLDTLKRIAAYFHVSTDYLVGYDGEARSD
jgi:transcriptional regulator with XRE-family HTH domain